MNVLIIGKKFDNYSTRRLFNVLEKRNYKVQFISPLNCTLRLEGKSFDIIYQHDIIPQPEIAILRCISYTDFGVSVTRDLELYLGIHLKNQGVLCVNDPEAKFKTSSKFLAFQILNNKNIPTLPTYLIADLSEVPKILNKYLDFPMIVKTNEGTWGMGVELVGDIKMAQNIFKKRIERNRIILFQNYIKEAQEQDIRVFVVNGRAIAAMRRISQNDNFRSNIHQGGKAECIDLPDSYKNIAISATKALGLEIAGVDILETKSGPLVLEVNPSPGLEQIEKTTNVDIANQIVDYLETLL